MGGNANSVFLFSGTHFSAHLNILPYTKEKHWGVVNSSTTKGMQVIRVRFEKFPFA